MNASTTQKKLASPGTDMIWEDQERNQFELEFPPKLFHSKVADKMQKSSSDAMCALFKHVYNDVVESENGYSFSNKKETFGDFEVNFGNLLKWRFRSFKNDGIWYDDDPRWEANQKNTKKLLQVLKNEEQQRLKKITSRICDKSKESDKSANHGVFSSVPVVPVKGIQNSIEQKKRIHNVTVEGYLVSEDIGIPDVYYVSTNGSGVVMLKGRRLVLRNNEWNYPTI